MKKPKWHNFTNQLPLDDSAIMIIDHEGNRASGIWENNNFSNAQMFPIGIPVKWTYIEVIITCGEIESCRIFYENGEEINFEDLYDFNEPIKEKK